MHRQKTRIAMFLPTYFPHFGGTQLAAYNISRELTAQDIVSLKMYTFYKNSFFNSKKEKDIWSISPQKAEIQILKYHSIGWPKIKDLSIKSMLDLKNSNEDIIHVQGAHRPISLFLIEKILRGKITILTTHTLQESVSILLSKKIHPLLYPLYVNSLKNLTHIIALSQMDVNLLLSMGLKREKITVIPNGIDERKFEKRRTFVNKNKKIKILCVAQFNPNKNFEAVIKVVESLCKTFDLEAYLVGAMKDEDYLRKILQMVKDTGIEEIVRFGVSIDDAALVDCYLSCDLFLFLSYVETLPIVVLEAMYAGLPIVASRVGGIPEIVRDGVNGFLVSPDNIQEICICVSKLLEDQKLRKEIGIQNKQIAKSYTWSKVALATSQLYKKLIEESKED